MKKNCLICDAEFEPYLGRKNSKYCNPKCLKEANRRRQKTPEHYAKKNAARRQKKITISCKTCGEDFTGVGNRAYCSKTCSSKRSSWVKVKPTEKECIVCKTTFNHGRKDKRICSLECKKAHTKEYKKKFNKNTIANCKICGEEFQKKRNNVYCSKTCSGIAYKVEQKKWRADNWEHLSKEKKAYAKANRDKLIKRRKEVYGLKYPIIDKECKECNTVFTPSSSGNHIKYCSKKCQFNNWSNQPKNKLNWAVQDAVRRGLRPKICIRKSKYLDGLDFTMDELRIHLENQFDEWMNWDNHGLWHIDHIRPVASFEFTSMEDEDFKKCWALENLQPLKDTENMRKNHYYNKAKEMKI